MLDCFRALSSDIQGETIATTQTKVLVVISYQISWFYSFNCFQNDLWILVVGSGMCQILRICRMLNSLVIGSTVAYMLMNYPIKLRQRVGVTKEEQSPFEVGNSRVNDLRLFSVHRSKTLFLQFFSEKFALLTSNSYSFWQREGLNYKLCTSYWC